MVYIDSTPSRCFRPVASKCAGSPIVCQRDAGGGSFKTTVISWRCESSTGRTQEINCMNFGVAINLLSCFVRLRIILPTWEIAGQRSPSAMVLGMNSRSDSTAPRKTSKSSNAKPY